MGLQRLSWPDLGQPEHQNSDNTGLCVCVCVCVLVTQSCLTLQLHGLKPGRLLCPWDSPGKNNGVGSRYLLQGDRPDPGIELRSPALQADFLSSEPPGKPLAPPDTPVLQDVGILLLASSYWQPAEALGSLT